MQSSSPGQTALLVAVLLVAAVLVRRGRNDPASKDLGKRQRIRPLALEWLDPVIAAADAHSATLAQIALAWVIRRPAVVAIRRVQRPEAGEQRCRGRGRARR
jgi:MYXO-CTERM domain-containing protein